MGLRIGRRKSRWRKKEHDDGEEEEHEERKKEEQELGRMRGIGKC